MSRRGLFVDAEIFERLQHVEITLAGGDDAEARVRRIDHDAVDAVGARERARGLAPRIGAGAFPDRAADRASGC